LTKTLNEKQKEILWKRIMAEAENIPSLPDIANKILEQISNPNSTPKDFQEIISKDPVLTAKVLKMANSAYYGYSREIETISEAIVILGLNTLRSLVIAISAYTSLNREAEGYGLQKGGLWRHSLATAIGAKIIAKQNGYKETEKFFVAGLLHDIGKIILSKHILRYIDEISTLAKMRDISFEIAESEVMGFNHCTIGSDLANFWKLPQLFADVTKFHHSPEACISNNVNIVEIVHIADIISYLMKVGLGKDGNYYKPSGQIFDKYNIDNKAKELLIKNVNSSLLELEKTIV